MVTSDLNLQRIQRLEEELEQLKAKKQALAYRLIEADDRLSRYREQTSALTSERDTARSWAESWYTEAKEQENRADAAEADAQKFQQAAQRAQTYAFNTENALNEARHHNECLAFQLYQERALTASLRTALHQRDEMVTFGKGLVQGMLKSQEAMQGQVQALQDEVISLADENDCLRFLARTPQNCCHSSDTTPASTVQCSESEQPQPEDSFQRLRIGSSLQHTPSVLCCAEGTGTSEPRPDAAKTSTVASDSGGAAPPVSLIADCTGAAASGLTLIADCTIGRSTSPDEAQEPSNSSAQSMAEEVLCEWVEQPHHLMARPLQRDLAQRAERDLAEPKAAAKKTSIRRLIGRALGALFGSGQHKGPILI